MNKKALSIFVLSIIGMGLVSCKKENKAQEQVILSGHPKDGIDSAAQISSSPAEEVKMPAQSTQPSTTIALSESNFDFGKIKKGDKVEHEYEITNTGKNPLVISEVKPGCGCTAPDFTKEPIMPGKKGKITLHFDSTNFEGNVQKYADVFANVDDAPIQLTFTANIQP
ncbi:DUF1573 domain-containing protein [Chryseobacterium potabilaquae]|nr:DUF1573 domain-containing protein [Chryseobacterium potabilaquae]